MCTLNYAPQTHIQEPAHNGRFNNSKTQGAGAQLAPLTPSKHTQEEAPYGCFYLLNTRGRQCTLCINYTFIYPIRRTRQPTVTAGTSHSRYVECKHCRINATRPDQTGQYSGFRFTSHPCLSKTTLLTTSKMDPGRYPFSSHTCHHKGETTRLGRLTNRTEWQTYTK